MKTWKHMEVLQIHNTKWKKPMWKEYIIRFQLCNVLENTKLLVAEEKWVVVRWDGRMKKQNMEDF